MTSRQSPLSLGTVDLTPEDIERAVTCLRRGQLSPGPTTQAFERAVAQAHRLPYATYCNSGQSALHLILEALKTQGHLRRVCVPAITYISSLHAVWSARAAVHLVDVHPQTYLADWTTTTLRDDDVLMPVHLCGLPAPLPSPLLTRYHAGHLTVVEDACEAFGAPGIGYGDAMAFSFYVAHTITTGVGGMVATRHVWLDDAVKRLCNHGRERAADLYAGLRVDHVDQAVRFRFTEQGFSYKLGDVSAALGIGQVERLPTILARRQQVAGWFRERLAPYPLQLPTGTGHTYMMFPLVCREDGVRDRLMTHLGEAGIETRHLMPVTNQPIVCRMLGNSVEERFPVARQLNARGFYVGCHQQMTEDDADRLHTAIRAFFGL